MASEDLGLVIPCQRNFLSGSIAGGRTVKYIICAGGLFNLEFLGTGLDVDRHDGRGLVVSREFKGLDADVCEELELYRGTATVVSSIPYLLPVGERLSPVPF
jgi:hypothetical protein